MHRLARYLAEHALTLATFGARIGVSAEAIRRYAYEGRVPRTAVMHRIILATGGAVTPNDWFSETIAEAGLPPARNRGA